jgi:hypothetical protein
MVWTILWFKYHEQEWERWYKTYSKPGLKAYATKQKDVWERFRKKAKERFGMYITLSEIVTDRSQCVVHSFRDAGLNFLIRKDACRIGSHKAEDVKRD